METNDNWSVSPPTSSLGKASKEEQAQLLDFLASPLVAAAFDEDCDEIVVTEEHLAQMLRVGGGSSLSLPKTIAALKRLCVVHEHSVGIKGHKTRFTSVDNMIEGLLQQKVRATSPSKMVNHPVGQLSQLASENAELERG